MPKSTEEPEHLLAFQRVVIRTLKKQSPLRVSEVVTNKSLLILEAIQKTI